jgi:glycosyltransferase involved in cell wall biosynthesis
MFDPGAVFMAAWLAVGRRVADLIRLRATTRSGAEGDARFALVEGFRGLYRDRAEPRSFAYVAPAALPYRAFGRLTDLPKVRALERALAGIAASHGPVDVLHGHFYADARPLPWLRRRLGLPYVVTEHSSALSGQSPDQVITRAGLRVAKRVYANAACVLPVSYFLERAIERLGLSGRFVVIDNPVDSSVFGLASAYRGGRFRIVCTARLEAVKAVDVLIRAAARLAAAGVDPELTVFGEGSQREQLLALAGDLGLTERVHLPGHRPRSEVFGALSGAHAFSLASLVEGQPFAVIEALCTGLPVIATSVGGLPELVGPSEGHLVSPHDPEALADALMTVAREPRRFNPNGIAARARTRFSYETVGARLSQVYAEATRSETR